MNDTKTVEAAVYAGFRRVGRLEFYATVGPINVHPYPQDNWGHSAGYDFHWKVPSGDVIAISDSRDGERYFLRESRFPLSQ